VNSYPRRARRRTKQKSPPVLHLAGSSFLRCAAVSVCGCRSKISPAWAI